MVEMSVKEKSYECSLCGKVFRVKNCLKIHELTHKQKHTKYGLNTVDCRGYINEGNPSVAEVVSRSQIGNGIENLVVEDCKDKQPFECNECGKHFVLLTSLKVHMLNHSLKDTDVCTVGNEFFLSQRTLKHCKDTHDPKETLQDPNFQGITCQKLNKQGVCQITTSEYTCNGKTKCMGCKEEFLSVDCLKEHNDQSNYSCNTCKQIFTSCKSFKMHRKSQCLKCNVCNSRFSCKEEFKKHKLSRKQELICSICHKKFAGCTSLRNHIKIHFRENVQCEICSNMYPKKTYKLHLRTHTGERPYKCEDCGMTFVQKPHLLTHEKSHRGQKDYQCGICNKRFAARQNLNLHYKIHDKEKFLKCEVCSKIFQTYPAVRQHLKTHFPRKLFSCQLCDKNFNVKAKLQIHYKEHSQSELQQLDQKTLSFLSKLESCDLKLICEVCGKAFQHKSHLKIHQRLHTGEKPYKCIACDKKFRLKNSLVLHERTHSGDRPFTCNTCGKSFIQAAHFKCHIATHSNEKPFSCHVCGRSFTQKNNLTTHKKIHSRPQHSPSPAGNQSYVCSICGEDFASWVEFDIHLCPFAVHAFNIEGASDGSDAESVSSYKCIVVEALE